ncbi:VOC family protein [Devosia sp.]|uniref:VOC family protein n=1 Tax=Devosia sp. TaxID=1871048 RepID=UPI001AC4F30C|nr:VOC family protein [Devosia sp.]MBN9311252.1 VOC family protein [Devosia sp.]
MLLSDHRAYPTIPAADIGRAKAWYKDKLGLVPTEESPFGVIYRMADGTRFQLYPSQFAGTAQNTAMGFSSSDVVSDMKKLRERGVKFEEYNMPELKTENGMATMGSYHGAWFKDSEGNILAIGDEPN